MLCYPLLKNYVLKRSIKGKDLGTLLRATRGSHIALHLDSEKIYKDRHIVTHNIIILSFWLKFLINYHGGIFLQIMRILAVLSFSTDSMHVIP